MTFFIGIALPAALFAAFALTPPGSGLHAALRLLLFVATAINGTVMVVVGVRLRDTWLGALLQAPPEETLRLRAVGLRAAVAFLFATGLSGIAWLVLR